MNPVINFKAYGVKFYLDLEKQLTKISDDSGAGKTFLCNALRASLNTWKDTGEYPVKDKITNNNISVKIINGIEHIESQLLSTDNTLYIIDEADSYLSEHPEVIDIILNNTTSHFVFMLRAEILGLSFGYSEKAYLERDIKSKTIRMQYYN